MQVELSQLLILVLVFTHLGFGWAVWVTLERSYRHRIEFLDHGITMREQFIRQLLLKQGAFMPDVPAPTIENPEAPDTSSIFQQAVTKARQKAIDEDDEQARESAEWYKNAHRSVTDARNPPVRR